MADHDVPPLPCTCASVRRAGRNLTRLYDRALRETGLRLNQYSMLATIDLLNGATMSQMTERLGMERTTLNRNLRPLIAAGWVACDSGRRQHRFTLTAAGASLLDVARPLWQAAERDVRRRIGRPDISALHALTDRLAGLQDPE